MGAYEISDEVEEESLTLCPFSSAENTTSICWTCSIMCCCLPICYPCYLTHTLRERSKKKKLVISRKMCQANYGHKSDKKRVTSTIKSEQSTGTSGYETLLSRKGELVSLQPNVDKSRIHKAVVNTLDSNYRKNISAIFVATEAAHSFLTNCQKSELLQNSPIQNKTRIENCELINSSIDSVELNPEERLSKTRLSDNDNSSYSFSQLYLHLENDLLRDLEISSKMNMCEVYNHGFHESTIDKEFDKDGLFRYSGHVDVSEQSTSTRVCVTLEVCRENTQNLDPVQLANTYCRQLAKSNVVVFMITEKDRVKFIRKGLLDYVSKYWAGFFSVLYVEIDRRVKVNDGDMLLVNLERIFGCVETLSVKDDSNLAGSVFSALARMGIVMNSCNDL